LIEKYSEHCYIIQNPPALPLTEKEMDEIYHLPYMRAIHPSYHALGGVPAIEEVRFSLTSNRGCFGSCNFCSLAFHQGRIVQVRSHDSLIEEAKQIIDMPDFKGYIHDVGGPTANFRKPACEKQLKSGMCKGKHCLTPTPCKNLVADHSEYIELLKRVEAIDGIKRVFIRSGIRFDYLTYDKSDAFFKKLVRDHVSGQLKVAPEHCSNNVLMHMGKPPIEVYDRFKAKYFSLSKEVGKEQYLVPYLMSSHPGSTLQDAITLALYLKENRMNPEQVQDFYPTPGTASTVMYYTEIDPFTMKQVYVAKSYEEKKMQRALLQYRRPENSEIIMKALQMAGRKDLIGYGPDCLVKPPKAGSYRKPDSAKPSAKGNYNKKNANRNKK
jgi:uncharacterized radical SAM protein YgiQ